MNDVPKNEPTRVSPEVLESLGFTEYKGPVPLDELPFPPDEDNGDFEWAANDQELHRRYQRLVVAVRNRQVWGAGKNARAAWEDARRKAGCPAEGELVYVPIWGMPGDPENPETRKDET
jgi:hypothetical protein